MIISSEHHDLLEQFKTANEEQGKAINTLLAYFDDPNFNMETSVKLSQQMEEATNKCAIIYRQLEAVRLDR